MHVNKLSIQSAAPSLSHGTSDASWRRRAGILGVLTMTRNLMAALAAVPFFMTIVTGAEASVILSYSSVSAAEIAAADAGAGVTAAALKRGSGLTAQGSGFSSTGYDTGSEGAAIAANDYLTFGFSSADPYDLTAVDFGYTRTGQGPVQISLGVAINGGAYQSLFTDASVATGGQTASIDLTTLVGVTEAFFYLSGWSAGNASNGQFRLLNLLNDSTYAIALSGKAAHPPVPEDVVAPVPLPAALPLLAAALAGTGMVARRRKR